MPRHFFIKHGPRAAAAALAVTALSSCQSVAPATTPISVASMENAPQVTRGLDAESLSTLLIAELAGLRGDYGRATDGYIQTAERYKSAKLAQRAALAARFMDDPDTLEATTQRWKQLAPNSEEPLYLLASLAIQRQDWLRALELRLAISNQGRDAQLLELVEIALEANANTSAMLAQMRQHLNDAANSHVDSELAMALLEAANGLQATAQQRLERLPAAAAEHPDAWRLRAAIALDTGAPQRAYDSARQGLKLQPEDLQLMMLQAQAEIRLGRTENAEATTDALLEKHGSTSGLRLLLASLYLQENQPDPAHRLLQPLLSNGTTPDSALLMLGGIAQNEDDVDSALLYYRKVPEGKNFLLSRSRAAFTLASHDRLIDGQRFLASERRAHPAFSAGLIGVEVNLLDRFGQSAQATNLLTDFLNQHPGNAELRHMLAIRAFRDGDLAMMEAQLRIALEQDPNDAVALNALGYTLADEQIPSRIDEAARLIERAYQLDPDNPAVLDSLGWVRFRQGDPQAALPLLEKAWQQMPDQEVASHLIEVLWTLGQQTHARQMLKLALERFAQRPAIDELLQRIPALSFPELSD
ncbi:tetratricopeptide repeat protein [Halomonas halocynthiae]|uniref:tetratricopeptide repeat protein n=1 Tax=Halomonas halocynthiae TaxID=176290 RepID=UPI0003FF0673|nr:tetratricopeptide repeat protein [Halomonas halocynthiae]